MYGYKEPAGPGLPPGSYSCLPAQPRPARQHRTHAAHLPCSLPVTKTKEALLQGTGAGTRQQEMPGPALPSACLSRTPPPHLDSQEHVGAGPLPWAEGARLTGSGGGCSPTRTWPRDPSGFRIPGARGVPQPTQARDPGSGGRVEPPLQLQLQKTNTWALSTVSTFFDSQAASELCPPRCLGGKWEPGLMILGLLGSLMTIRVKWGSGVGLLPTSSSRWAPTPLSVQARALATVSTCPSGVWTKPPEAQGRGSAAGRAMGLQVGSCTLWTSVSPAAHTGWPH